MGKLKNAADYSDMMARIDALMSKGSKNVSLEELVEIKSLAIESQRYESQQYYVEPPSTLTGMIEMRMYEMRLKQKDLARKLNISDAKLSMIMNGKQKPDVDFLKAVHTELKVDAEFILGHV